MSDLMQQARELLAAEYSKIGKTFRAEDIRNGRVNSDEHLAINAIRAALRAAPEGFVMVPVEPTDEMKRAGTAHVSNPYGLARDVWAAMLAARPQGVES